MPYLRYNKYMGVAGDNAESIEFIKKSMRDKVYNGNAVAVTKTPNGDVCEYMIMGSGDGDAVTNYSFYFGYNNGHPCIFITFSAIDDAIKSKPHILCIETENYNKKPYGRWQCINVFEKKQEECGHPEETLEYITWYYMNEIEVGREYCIYIIASQWALKNGRNRYSEIKRNGYPDDWEMRLMVRPTIRTIEGHFYSSFQKNLQHFIPVKYPISSEK